jgi:hypothetical protein
MQKTNTRDYIVSIFKLYSILGFPDAEQIENTQYIKDPYTNDYESANAALKADLIAAFNTLEYLKTNRKTDIINAIQQIYLFDPKRLNIRGEILNRVIDFSRKNYVDIRTVYRWLAFARDTCARLRGLRTIEEKDLIIPQ